MEYYGIRKFSELINVTQQSLRNWDKTRRLKPHHLSKGGYRYYSQEQLYHYLGLKTKVQKIEKSLDIAAYQAASKKTTLTGKLKTSALICAQRVIRLK